MCVYAYTQSDDGETGEREECWTLLSFLCYLIFISVAVMNTKHFISEAITLAHSSRLQSTGAGKPRQREHRMASHRTSTIKSKEECMHARLFVRLWSDPFPRFRNPGRGNGTSSDGLGHPTSVYLRQPPHPCIQANPMWTIPHWFFLLGWLRVVDN